VRAFRYLPIAKQSWDIQKRSWKNTGRRYLEGFVAEELELRSVVGPAHQLHKEFGCNVNGWIYPRTGR
jgi:hypothetical protein